MNFKNSSIDTTLWHIKNALESIYTYQEELGHAPDEEGLERLRSVASEFTCASAIMDMILTDAQINTHQNQKIKTTKKVTLNSVT